MTHTQFDIASKLLINLQKMEWISDRDFDNLLFILEMIYEQEKPKLAKFRLDYLETLPREKGYEILETIGYQL